MEKRRSMLAGRLSGLGQLPSYDAISAKSSSVGLKSNQQTASHLLNRHHRKSAQH